MQVISVGRALQNNVVIPDPKVSNLHLKLRNENDERYFVVDLNSTNGTFVNGKRIQGESQITPGDQLKIGNTLLPWESYFKDDNGGGALVTAAGGGWGVLTIVLTAVGGLIGLFITLLFVLNVAGVYHKKYAHVTVDSLEMHSYDEYINDSLIHSVLVQNLLDSINQARRLGYGSKSGRGNKGGKVKTKPEDSVEVVIVEPTEIVLPPDVDENVPFFRVIEKMPEFPGGDAALMKFISDNVLYPAIAQENGIQGRAVCQFTVEKDGSITDIQIVCSAGDETLDKEAMRVIKLMPRWKPGEQRGRPVRVCYTIPINFKLQ
jgi:TonB family protein